MDDSGFKEYQKSLKERFEELEDKALLRLKADQTAFEVAEELVDNEHIFKLSDDEVDLLKAYRSQRQRKARGLFRWRYSTEDMIVTPENPSLIIDPRDESNAN